jgi:hypothetical protein
MKTALKKIFDTVAFLFGIRSNTRDNAVDVGLCDFSGQGRDKYGR